MNKKYYYLLKKGDQYEKKLSDKELKKISGGGINLNINAAWSQVRDTLKGFGDGLFGHGKHY
ncbi:bacteriocin [Enterococcus faecalis]|uniref:bacteriocin n=1 Tax=Enterococcus faecalis TaxID=1351 RepID=UPI00312BE907